MQTALPDLQPNKQLPLLQPQRIQNPQQLQLRLQTRLLRIFNQYMPNLCPHLSNLQHHFQQLHLLRQYSKPRPLQRRLSLSRWLHRSGSAMRDDQLLLQPSLRSLRECLSHPEHVHPMRFQLEQSAQPYHQSVRLPQWLLQLGWNLHPLWQRLPTLLQSNQLHLMRHSGHSSR